MALKVVHHHFRPEFLNRIDETVVFEALSPLQLREIARLQVSDASLSSTPPGCIPIKVKTRIALCFTVDAGGK